MLFLGEFRLFKQEDFLVILGSISNGLEQIFFGFHGLICKYFGGVGPKYIFWGKFLFFWLDIRLFYIFFQNLCVGGGEGRAMAPLSPNIGPSLI